jgi:flagellar L-ring protein precursor FlgH
MKYTIQGVIAITLLSLTSAACFTGKANVRVTDPTDLRAYVESAHKQSKENSPTEGSLWTGNGYYSSLYRDPKARFVNDMVTIVVSETTQAVASADAKSTRDTANSAGFDHLFGIEKKISEIPTLVSGKSSSSFTGTGETSRATTLQTTLSARVVDVLPNGYLLVEGFREIRVNNENQSLYLTGVIRPDDIALNNTIPSAAVAQMSVRVQGRGVVSQPTKPGWLYKILTGILPF